MFGGSRPTEDCWTGSAEAATLRGWSTLLAVEKAVFPSPLGSAEDQIHPDEGTVVDSDFAVVVKDVMWQVPVFDGKTTSWKRFEREFTMAIRHLRLDSVLAGNKEEISVADRTISRDCLPAHCGKSKVAKYFAL